MTNRQKKTIGYAVMMAAWGGYAVWELLVKHNRFWASFAGALFFIAAYLLSLEYRKQKPN